MVAGASDVDSSSSDAQSSSSSEDEDAGRRKGKKSASWNLSGLSCVVLEGFCGMAHSSSSKKSKKEDSDSDSEDEVNRDPDSLLAEITRLNGLINNRDSVLRDAKKMRKDLMAQLENASEKVGELESKLLELKLENDSLKLTPTISDNVDCPECDAWLNVIKLLNEKNASTLAKLDALRTEYDEHKARPTLLGACKSCSTMHDKLVDARSTISTLEASLKSPVVDACTSCDEVTLRYFELTSRLDVIYEENDYLRKVLGWLSRQEPQLKIMIEEFKRADGRGLAFQKLGEKVGENSG
jgi:DNA repair exonuclease SbcCD ATPase subunit